jgi:hypothetical protein
VDWWCLNSRGASGGVLIMWVTSLWLSPLENVEDNFTWAFAGVYGPNSNRDRGLLEMSWLVYLVGGTCLGALRVILMLLDSQL